MATRIGTSPADRPGADWCSDNACSAVFRVDGEDGLNAGEVEGMSEGTFYGVVGTLATTRQFKQMRMPEDANVADYEALVFVPEAVLLDAAMALLASRQQGASELTAGVI